MYNILLLLLLIIIVIIIIIFVRNADLYFNLGVLYAEKEKWDSAKVNYELAIHFDPRHANGHNNLGVIHRPFGACSSTKI